MNASILLVPVNRAVDLFEGSWDPWLRSRSGAGEGDGVSICENAGADESKTTVSATTHFITASVLDTAGC
jgi:hypothetical protein